MNLRSKPVHSGLGFHPFENGLPYTPAQPKQTVKRTAAPTKTETQKPVEPQVKAEPATLRPSVFSKWAATALDTLVLAGVASLVLLVVLFSQGLSLTTLTDGISPVFVCLYYLAFHYSVLTAQEILTRKSLGKAFFGLEIEKNTDAISILFRSAQVKNS